MATILIKNGRVWDGERLLKADVLTRDERVEKIAPHITDPADIVYDATGKLVSAGFVDVHVHMRGISCDAFGVSAELSCIPFGVTAAADASGDEGDLALLDSFLVKSAVFVTAPIRNNRFVSEGLEAALARYGARTVGLKVYFDASSGEVRDITPLQDICRYARVHGLRVMVHCASSPAKMAEILQTLGTGDILTHAFHGGANNAAEDDFASMKAAQARGVVIDAGMAGHVHTDFGVFSKAIQCGVIPDLIGSDITKRSAYTRGGRYGLTACMRIAEELGMCEEDVLLAVTSKPARVLGKIGQWGRLFVGGIADIAVLAEADDPLDMTDCSGNRFVSARGKRCVLTVCNGQIVYKN